MKTEFVDVSPTRKEIKIEIEVAAVRESYDRISDRYAKQARVPGFRPGHAPRAAQGGNPMGGMTMGGGAVPNLKTLDPQDRVQSINHCGDTYKVTTADGKMRDFWERNLRFKTDVSDDGPQKGAPALVDAGMMGDRADVIFGSPEEISGFIADRC